MEKAEVMKIVNRKELDNLKHDFLRTRALLYLAIEKLGGELLVSREEYLAIKDTDVPIGMTEMLPGPYCECPGRPRISFNMGEPIWAATYNPESD